MRRHRFSRPVISWQVVQVPVRGWIYPRSFCVRHSHRWL